MRKNWTSRDWKWLMGVLIAFIILLIVLIITLIAIIYAKNVEIEANFSIISSAVSIALALVAIFFAFKQDSDSRITHDNLVTRLENIIIEVGSVKDQVAHFSKTDIQEIKEKAYENTKLDVQKSTYTKEEADLLIQEALTTFGEEVETILKIDELKKRVTGGTIPRLLGENLEEAIILILNETDGKYSVDYVQKRLRVLFGTPMTKDEIDRFYNRMLKLGKI